jgi:hypothetical protein
VTGGHSLCRPPPTGLRGEMRYRDKLVAGLGSILVMVAVVIAAPLTSIDAEPLEDIPVSSDGDEEALALESLVNTDPSFLDSSKDATPLNVNEVPKVLSKHPGLVHKDKTITKEDLSLDLTPKAVAEYLLITGDFEGFDKAVEDLLKSNIVKPEEARQYKDTVGTEYEALLHRLVDAKEAYLQEFVEAAAAEQDSLQQRVRRGQNQLAASIPKGGKVELGMTLRRLQLRSLLEREATLDELLQALVEDYLIKGLTGAKENAVTDGKDLQEDDMEQLINLMANAVNQGTNNLQMRRPAQQRVLRPPQAATAEQDMAHEVAEQPEDDHDDQPGILEDDDVTKEEPEASNLVQEAAE